MGKAVFTCAKPNKGTAAGGGLSAHIERQVWDDRKKEMVPFRPKSVTHPELTYQNKEYILAQGVSRSEAIEQRIREAGITRKIRDNQVRCLAFLCTSDRESMDAIVAAGRADEYAQACIDFGRKTFGEKNVVSAVSHFDETTFHIHMSVVPIVAGQAAERPDTKKQHEARGGKEKRAYNKQKVVARLCAKEVFTPENAEQWQDDFVAFMHERGFEFERGLRGSKARHVNPADYNARMHEKKVLDTMIDELTEELGTLSTQHRDLAAEIAKKQKAVKGLTTMIDNLERQRNQAMADGRADVSALEAQIAEKRSKLVTAERQLMEISAQKDTAQKDLRTAEKGFLARIFVPSKYKEMLAAERTAGAKEAMKQAIAATGLNWDVFPSPEKFGKTFRDNWDKLKAATSQHDNLKQIIEQETSRLETSLKDAQNMLRYYRQQYENMNRMLCTTHTLLPQDVLAAYETFTAAGLSDTAMRVAWNLFLGYVNNATSIAESQGGGASPEALLGWRGKDDDEDYEQFARRCARTAKMVMTPRVAISSGGGRKR